jgi:hypothetical protein
MNPFSKSFSVTTIAWRGPQRVLPCLASAHKLTRRSLPVVLALGATVTMVATAQAAVEGQDTSKGGEAPGADLRYGRSHIA